MSKPTRPPLPGKEEILRFIEENEGEVGKREIARAFRLRGADRLYLKKILRELADEGHIGRGHRRRVQAAGALPGVTVIEITGSDGDGELLARPDIDALLIATGDRWHPLVSIAAAQAGKDMYCEKPMSVCITESRAVSDTMRRLGRIFQCGTQRRSLGNFRFAVNLARSGKLGRLKELQAEQSRAFQNTYETILPAEPEPPREEFDWNRWLGPTP